ncbi:substrate-binding domain-containing protein [Aggregatilineales bacterium SYSU G02658]
MQLRKWLTVGALALVGVLGVRAQEGEPLRIALLSDQSGALALYGTELENGFKLGLIYAAGLDPANYDTIDAALADVVVAGRPVELLVRDTASDADRGASEARSALEQAGAELLVGAPSSGVTVGLQQVALDYDVLLFAAPGASPAITGANFNENTFRACRNTAQDALALASFATEGLGQKWIILAADYEFGRASEASFRATLGAFGVEFVSETIFAPLETTDFTPFLQQVLASGAEAMLPIWAGDTSVALFQQIAELGVNSALNVVGAFNSNDIVRASDPSTVGNVSWIVYHYSFPQNEINDWMVENHLKFFGGDVPDLFTECGFATAQVIVAGLEATGGDTLPEALGPAIEGLVWEGPKGTYYMRPGDHQALVPMYIARLVNLDDPDQKYYELLSEVSAFASAPPCGLVGDFAERCALNDAFMAEIMQ